MRVTQARLTGSPSVAAARGAARVLSAGLGGLGLVFLSRPAEAARIFGIPSSGRLDYVRALGIRDLALAAGLSAASIGAPRSLAATAGIASLIPAADMLLVGWARRGRGRGSLALHALSMIALLVVAVAADRASTRTGRQT